MYLMKYGYMDVQRESAKSAPLLSQDGLRDYIKEFQSFAGLPQTGELDQDTVECGADEHSQLWGDRHCGERRHC